MLNPKVAPVAGFEFRADRGAYVWVADPSIEVEVIHHGRLSPMGAWVATVDDVSTDIASLDDPHISCPSGCEFSYGVRINPARVEAAQAAAASLVDALGSVWPRGWEEPLHV